MPYTSYTTYTTYLAYLAYPAYTAYLPWLRRKGEARSEPERSEGNRQRSEKCDDWRRQSAAKRKALLTGEYFGRMEPAVGLDARAKPAASLSEAKATGSTESNPPFFATAKNDQSKKKKQWRTNFICQSHCLLFAGIAHGFWKKAKKKWSE